MFRVVGLEGADSGDLSGTCRVFDTCCSDCADGCDVCFASGDGTDLSSTRFFQQVPFELHIICPLE